MDAIKVMVHGGNQNALKAVRFPKASDRLLSWIPDYNLTRNKSATSSGLEEDLEGIKDPLLTNGSSPLVIGNGPKYRVFSLTGLLVDNVAQTGSGCVFDASFDDS